MYTLNKIVGFFCLLLSVQAAGQDLAAAKQLWAEKRIVAAREAIDNYLQENGNDDANGWLLKAAIYFAISSDLQLKSLVADGRMEAFTAIKKAVSLDGGLASGPAAKEIFTILPAIYQGYTTDGVAFYNAAVERQATVDYGHALSHFKKAMQVSDFYSTQGWKLLIAPSDSVLLYNAAQAAIHAGNEDEAILYCRKLADRKIYQAGAYSRQDFESIYQWLVNYYHIKKDGQNLQKYVAIAAIMYPQSVYFPTISINNYLETGNYPALITAGEAALQRFPANNVLRYSLGSGLFTYTYASTTTAGTKKKLYVKLEQQLKALIKSEPDSARGHLLLGKHLYNKAADLQKNAGSKSVLFALTECIKSLKICIQKASGANNDIRQEALRILVTTLKATGQPKEAELYTSEAMDQ